jgi:hypothetical protein
MSRRAGWVETEIARRLEEARAPDSPNRLTAARIRTWAVEYLGRIDQDEAEYPSNPDKSHWDLLMQDGRREDALFAVLVFHADGVEFFCGTGEASDVIQFCSHDFPDDPAEMYDEMSRRFTVPEPGVTFDRPLFEKWLGRSW